MATTSPNLGLNMPDNTDVFDNDLFLKGNLQKLDDTVLAKTKTVAADGQNMETLEVTFTSGGTANSLSANGTFAKTYANPPTVLVANITQTFGYMDAMAYPFINNVTKTGFNCVIKTAVTSNNFGAGTGKIKFLVFGS